MTTKNEDLASIENMPGYLKKDLDIGGGLEDMGPEDTLVPRIALGQALNPQVEQDIVPKGCLFDTSLDEVLALLGVPLKVCILSWVKSYIEWGDRESGGGIISIERPGGELEKRAKAGEKNDKKEWAVTEYHNYVVALVIKGVVRLDRIKAVSMCRTGLKHAKRLNVMLQRRDKRIFVGLWDITSDKEMNRNKQTYFVVKWKPSGWIPKDQYDEILSLHQQLEEGKDKIRIQIDDNKDETEELREGESSEHKDF